MPHPRGAGTRRARAARVAWALATAFVVESVVVALAALPAVSFWAWHFRWRVGAPWLRVLVLAASFVPAYFVFAVALAALSALATRALGWRTPPGAALRIAACEWPLLDWGRGLVATHVVRLLAGPVFRATPLWTWYLRSNGARVGRGAFVNSLALMDHALLDFGDGVVVGSDAHVSGHTVEGGVVKTAAVRLGDRVTVGVGSVIEIGAEVGDGAQIGALSFVPKYARLAGGAAYAGCPVRPIRRPRAGPPARDPPNFPRLTSSG